MISSLLVLLALGGSACGDDGSDVSWQIIQRDLDGALLSVWGSSAQDVWAVGGDSLDGKGPTVLHYDGSVWERLETGETEGTLWWIHGFTDGPIYMGGTSGMILRYQDGSFTKLGTPGTGTVFGLWGSSPSDMWAVGGESESGGGFAWRLQGDTWSPEPTLPDDVPDTGAIWKIHGRSANDAWLVGSNGIALHWDGATLEPGQTGVGSSLFTVFGNAENFAAVGGLASGIIVENDGSEWINVTPDPLPLSLTGVCLDADGGGYAVGLYGGVYRREKSGWKPESLGFGLSENLHAVWKDPDGGVWAVGGNTLISPVNAGVLIYKGEPLPAAE